MNALLSRADQAVSITDISRSAKKYFDRLITGEQDRYIVMRNNAPAAVVLPVDYFESLISEIDDLQMEIVALRRLANMDENTELVSHEDMFARYK
jgi:antitoxin StbD